MTMNTPRLLSSSFGSLLVSATLAGCAAGPHAHMSHHGATGMDPKAMCEMHRKEMAGKTAAEQQALMQEHMQGMAPDMRQRMQEMHARCK